MIAAQCGCGERPQHGSPVPRSSGQAAIGQFGMPTAFGQLLDARASSGSGAATLLAADVRIDNRVDLFDKLGLARDELTDDESLFFLAYCRWGDQVVDHVLGDFACAVWDSRHECITLLRDPTGQRPLYYHIGQDFVAFASMPQGLLGLGGVSREINVGRLAGFVADIPGTGPATFFRDISRVEPAHIVRITRQGIHTRRYWNMPTGELSYRNSDDYIEAFREHLNRATRARLRGAGRVVAAHLSAGLDSAAIASTAARLLASTGGRLLAVTSAPRVDFAGSVPFGRIADESPVAAELAALYPNMDHLILRSTGASPLNLLDDDSQLFAQPVGFPCNNVWWGAANMAARSRGANVILTGETGNLTISAGGLGVLADLLRARRYGTWLREVIALEKRGPRWRGLLAASFLPWLPAGVLSALEKFSSGGVSAESDSLLAGGMDALVPSATPESWTSRSRRSEREVRWDMLKASDPGNFRKGALLRWGIDERDPTADRRLVEFCFSLPPSQLLGGGQTRRLARVALSDRLPAAILNGARGYQYADWYEALDKPALARVARRIAANPVAAGVIDVEAMDRLIEEWPLDDWASAKAIGTYRIGLLRALSAGVFALNAAGEADMR